MLLKCFPACNLISLSILNQQDTFKQIYLKRKSVISSASTESGDASTFILLSDFIVSNGYGIL